jgi:hypothetical protein
MEENMNTEIDIENYEDFEAYDIITEADFVSLNSTPFWLLAQLNPILAATLQVTLAGLSAEEIMKMAEQSQIEATYLNYLREAKEEEQHEWNSIARTASPTSILITIFNSTNEVFSLHNASWDYSGHPVSDFDIEPLQHLCFTLRHQTPVVKRDKPSKYPTRINQNFSFKSASHAFEFSTSIRLKKQYEFFSFSPPTIPHREHTIRSVGAESLECSSQISRKLAERPYSYAVAITLG